MRRAHGQRHALKELLLGHHGQRPLNLCDKVPDQEIEDRTVWDPFEGVLNLRRHLLGHQLAMTSLLALVL